METIQKIERACKNGKIKLVKKYVKQLKSWERYELRDSLVIAAENNHLDIAKFLVEQGANPKYRDSDCLRRAVSIGNVALVKFLIEAGADVNADCMFDGCLYRAAGKGNMNMVKLLIEKGAIINVAERLQDTSYPPLFAAAKYRNFEILKFLHEKGGDLHRRSDHIMHIATDEHWYFGEKEINFEMMEYLILNGCDVNEARGNKFFSWYEDNKERLDRMIVAKKLSDKLSTELTINTSPKKVAKMKI